MTTHPDTADASLHVRVLGCAGAIAKGHRTTSFLVNGTVLVDAGTGVGDLTLDEMARIDHVLLSHSHLDHIAALPLMLDAAAARRNRPVTVHALPDTIAALQTHIFNDVIWPDFSVIPSPEQPFMVFQPFEVGQQLVLAGLHVEVLPAAHTVPAVGFALARLGRGAPHWVFSGDTGYNSAFWHRVNQLPVGMLVIETAFSDREAALAAISQHLCPQTLAHMLAHLPPHADYPIYITHAKPAEASQVMADIRQLNVARHASGMPSLTIDGLVTGQTLTL
jgi:ribonuclease BN (tRNA processing enzyme)